MALRFTGNRAKSRSGHSEKESSNHLKYEIYICFESYWSLNLLNVMLVLSSHYFYRFVVFCLVHSLLVFLPFQCCSVSISALYRLYPCSLTSFTYYFKFVSFHFFRLLLLLVVVVGVAVICNSLM